MTTNRDALRKIVCEIPSITGFSYPLLRLLVDESLKQEYDVRGNLTQYHIVLLRKIANYIGWPEYDWETTDELMREADIGPEEEATALMEVAEKFLAIFEDREVEGGNPTD